ncbi:MAG: CbiX/SirB N-terminal domain-containing protein [Sideroxydans sp.]|nr:CbiX/SirB N-terminal domain-containing protein [Sideroxydans sp.]
MSSAIVLFAHGARDPEWAQPFEKMRAQIQTRVSDTPVVLAFLELMQPTLGDAIANLEKQGVQQLTLIPMFLARGGHLKNDLPKLIAQIQTQHPNLTLSLSPAIGEVDSILQQLSDWVVREHQTRQTQ